MPEVQKPHSNFTPEMRDLDAALDRAGERVTTPSHGRVAFGADCICGDPACWQNVQAAAERASNPASKPPDTRTPEQVRFDEGMEAAENASYQEHRPEGE